MNDSAQFRPPKFLGPSHTPTHRMRCAVHGFIRFSDPERKIIDHPLFRRLRHIRQLALTELIYPGATHSRFEHSLGVMEIATRIFDRLAAENGVEMESIFAGVDALNEDPMARARQVCRLAGLLHDLGHCCFSHAAEKVISHHADHESLTALLLKEPAYLGQELDQLFFPGCADLTASLIKRQPNSPPQIQVLRDIVSGQVDADRSDYLLRDSLHCGVDYGRFDHLRLIECLTSWKDEDSGELVIGIKRDGIHSFEAMILARYQMNTQVYYHRLRRIYDYYLKEYFRTFDSTMFDTPDKILEWNDIKALNSLFVDSVNPDAPGHIWAKRIVERQHHRDVFSLDEGDTSKGVKIAKRISHRIQLKYPEVNFIEDLPDEPISIHKIARDNDREQQQIDFPILDRGKRTSLGDRSQIIKSLPPTFRIGYLFADVAQKELRDRIAAQCLVMRNEEM